MSTSESKVELLQNYCKEKVVFLQKREMTMASKKNQATSDNNYIRKVFDDIQAKLSPLVEPVEEIQ